MKGPARLTATPVGIRRQVAGGTAAAPWIAWGGLWDLVEPLLPRGSGASAIPGGERLPDREALQGILIVLHRGSPGSTCRPSWASARASPAGGV